VKLLETNTAVEAFEALLKELKDAKTDSFADASFHQKVIRHLKGIIAAWEDWIKSR
jgi:enamine deaminase RidA (YjgF/YER057c/UK114 family)